MKYDFLTSPLVQTKPAQLNLNDGDCGGDDEYQYNDNNNNYDGHDYDDNNDDDDGWVSVCSSLSVSSHLTDTCQTCVCCLHIYRHDGQECL